MKMALKLRDDIVALMEEYIRDQGSDGNVLSESGVSKLALGYGDFPGILLRWDGGAKGPTMQKIAQFEQWLREQMGKAKYEAFVARRAAMFADQF